jgi:hypothetical protein
MKALRIMAIMLFAGVAALMFATPSAHAQPQIVQRSCDTLSFDPPRVRVTFAVINLSTIPVCSVHLIPIPSGPFEPCHIFECSRPPGWDCFVDSAGAGHWRAGGPIPSPYCVGPFEKLSDFDIIIDPPYCCYHVLFDDPNGQIFYQGTVCFQCESPVKTTVRSWGQLKMVYR